MIASNVLGVIIWSTTTEMIILFLGCHSKHKICSTCFTRQVATAGCDNKITCPCFSEKGRKCTFFQAKNNYHATPRYEQTMLEIIEADSKLDTTQIYCEQHHEHSIACVWGEGGGGTNKLWKCWITHSL